VSTELPARNIAEIRKAANASAAARGEAFPSPRRGEGAAKRREGRAAMSAPYAMRLLDALACDGKGTGRNRASMSPNVRRRTLLPPLRGTLLSDLPRGGFGALWAARVRAVNSSP
jgi:hypothetical protein